jgi:signal transduction histidine kinase
MTKNSSIQENSIVGSKNISGIEKKALVAFLIIFLTVLFAAWGYAMKVRQTVVANNAAVTIDPGALIEVERMKNLAETQIANSRSFFLLGSKVFYDKSKQDKQNLLDALSNFQKKYPLPQIPEIVHRFDAIQNQLQEILEQGMEFREKQTESKIVGQFYQSKSSPLLRQMNENLEEMKSLHSAEINRVRAESRAAALGVESKIPEGMAILTALLVVIFLGMAVLVVKVLSEQRRQLAERDRLVTEAKNAVQAREEFISAINHDFKDPLEHLNQIAEILTNFSESSPIQDSGELVKTAVAEIETLIRDVCDLKMADQNGLTLRLDQMGVDDVLDDARVMMQPLAKQKGIRLQFESANPPILAFMDKERVLRVLANLLGNAIKFSPKNSKVTVKVRGDQQFVNISVADSGPGIPENKIPGLFTQFWQSRKTAEQGAGIGLGVVKTIVEAHGGTVRVDSHNGSGSTFTFSLPKRRPAGAELKKATPIRYTTKSRSQSDVFTEGPRPL